MSLTSYRAAPPRVGAAAVCCRCDLSRLIALRRVGRVLCRVLGPACRRVPYWLAAVLGACVVGACVRGCVCLCVCDCVRRPGGDRLSRTLRCSIMGAGGFHVRVRDGIGWGAAAMATRSSDAVTSLASYVHVLRARMRRGKGWVLVLRLGAGCVCCAMAMLACVAVCAAGNARSTRG
jgi:hypothetical protein